MQIAWVIDINFLYLKKNPLGISNQFFNSMDQIFITQGGLIKFFF